MPLIIRDEGQPDLYEHQENFNLNFEETTHRDALIYKARYKVVIYDLLSSEADAVSRVIRKRD